MSFYPKFDDPLFAFDAASVEDDELMLSGPAVTPPASPGTDPWNGPYGYPVTSFTNANGYTGYGLGPTKSWKFDTQLPDGWYTRISRRDKFS